VSVDIDLQDGVRKLDFRRYEVKHNLIDTQSK